MKESHLSGIYLGAIIVTVATLIYISATSLPSYLKEHSKNVNVQYLALTNYAKSAKINYRNLVQTAPEVVKENLEKAHFDSGFAEADVLEEKSGRLINKINLLVDKNNRGDAFTLDTLNNDAAAAIKKAMSLYRIPIKQASDFTAVITTVQQNPEYYAMRLETIVTSLETTAQRLTVSAQRHPNKAADIAGKLDRVTGLQKDGSELKTRLAKDLTDHNYLEIYQDDKQIEAYEISVNAVNKEMVEKMTQLDRSYLKILKDMQQRYYVVIGRSSWDESSDFDNSYTYIYKPVSVSPAQYDRIARSSGTLATGYLSNLQSYDGLWQAVAGRIDVYEGIPGRHDNAEFWVNDMPVAYYHRYDIIENGQRRTTDWVQVTADYYYAHQKDVGMEVVSKPYGMYESEASTVTAPAGMSYVGNGRYGEWRTDYNGHTYWHYHGLYSFMNDLLYSGHYYFRYEYDDYLSAYRAHKPYYGKYNEYGTGGTATVRGSYGNGSYANRATFATSVREAGSSARGRGPAGGGK